LYPSRTTEEEIMRNIAIVALLLLAATLGLAGDKPATETKQAQQVRATELAFAASARAKDVKQAVSFFDADIHFFQAGKMLSGIDEERKNWTALLTNPNLTITWEPEIVEASGGLGYTTGPFEIHVKQADGSDKVTRGRYVTIWRRKPDGSWKAAVDIGSAEPPPAKP
jgi:ketosteroid isomerase-like protein